MTAAATVLSIWRVSFQTMGSRALARTRSASRSRDRSGASPCPEPGASSGADCRLTVTACPRRGPSQTPSASDRQLVGARLDEGGRRRESPGLEGQLGELVTLESLEVDDDPAEAAG